MTTSRRDFLGILAAAPVVAPVVVREMAAAVTTPNSTLGHLLEGAEFKFYPSTAEEMWIDGARDFHPKFGNIHNFRDLTPLSDGSSAIGDVLLHPSIYPIEIPNRLYGAQINADGDAV